MVNLIPTGPGAMARAVCGLAPGAALLLLRVVFSGVRCLRLEDHQPLLPPSLSQLPRTLARMGRWVLHREGYAQGRTEDSPPTRCCPPPGTAAGTAVGSRRERCPAGTASPPTGRCPRRWPSRPGGGPSWLLRLGEQNHRVGVRCGQQGAARQLPPSRR